MNARLLAAGRAALRRAQAVFGVAVLLALLAAALFADEIARHAPGAVSLRTRLLPPSWMQGGDPRFLLGTDHLGRDVFSRIVHGARASLMVGGGTILIAGVTGSALGILAGYFRGWVDAVVNGLIETKLAFPGLLIVLIMMAALGANVWTLILVLSFNAWMVFARMARALVMTLRSAAFVEAATVAGAGPVRIMFRHLAPNLLGPLLTLAVLEFARVVLAEASLSFLGAGVQPPAISWGLDLASGKNYIFSAWWLVTFPGIAITLSVLGVNLLATWMRGAEDEGLIGVARN